MEASSPSPSYKLATAIAGGTPEIGGELSEPTWNLPGHAWALRGQLRPQAAPGDVSGAQRLSGMA